MLVLYVPGPPKHCPHLQAAYWHGNRWAIVCRSFSEREEEGGCGAVCSQCMQDPRCTGHAQEPHTRWPLNQGMVVVCAQVLHSMWKHVPYNGKLLREKTFMNWWKIRFFLRKKFCGLVAFATPMNATLQNLRPKLLQIATKLQNLWKFSSSKVSRYTVAGLS